MNRPTSEPKPKPPLDEIEIDYQHKNGGKGPRKPYLTISLDCLEAIFAREDATIAAEDVPRLMSMICIYAAQAGHGNVGLARAMEETYTEQVEDDSE